MLLIICPASASPSHGNHVLATSQSRLGRNHCIPASRRLHHLPSWRLVVSHIGYSPMKQVPYIAIGVHALKNPTPVFDKVLLLCNMAAFKRNLLNFWSHSAFSTALLYVLAFGTNTNPRHHAILHQRWQLLFTLKPRQILLWTIRYRFIHALPPSAARSDKDSSSSVQNNIWLNYSGEYCPDPHMLTAAARMLLRLRFQVSNKLPDFRPYHIILVLS